jgi:hypothetical protein
VSDHYDYDCPHLDELQRLRADLAAATKRAEEAERVPYFSVAAERAAKLRGAESRLREAEAEIARLRAAIAAAEAERDGWKEKAWDNLARANHNGAALKTAEARLREAVEVATSAVEHLEFGYSEDDPHNCSGCVDLQGRARAWLDQEGVIMARKVTGEAKEEQVTDKEKAQLIKNVVKMVSDGRATHNSWDGSFGRLLVQAFVAAGYVHYTPLSACSKASGEWHLKPGPKGPKKGLPVEIIEASFLGSFTQVGTQVC